MIEPGDKVILVDSSDREIGVAEKIEAHRGEGLLHRAFSVFVFGEQGRLLLQRRAAEKYHFPLLWTNSCCGHPRPGEPTTSAAQRRLREEMGLNLEMQLRGKFQYRAHDPITGLCENELDHVFLATTTLDPNGDPREVAEWKWEELDSIVKDLQAHAGRYTPWFPLALRFVLASGMPNRSKPTGGT